MTVLTFKLNEKLYLRDPQHTRLGQHIIRGSSEMIARLGFEHFTFKKLAKEIDSTEASIYRYFENKHRLLQYLVAWYWSWLNYRIDLATSSLPNTREKLKAALHVIAEEKKYDPTFQFVNEEALHRIVVAELDKTYLTKWVDNDNSIGLFGGFKMLCYKLGGFITELNPDYQYPHSLICTILLAANQQLFFIQHLPTLSNINKKNATQIHDKLEEFLTSLVFNAIDR